jgi:glycosyltransferase involved in cell wall biosynthesis
MNAADRLRAAPDQVVLDLSRLVYEARHATPSGIPRVELMYAKYLLARIPEHVQFATRDAFGRLCLLERAAAVEFVSAIEARWRDGAASRRARWRMAWRFHRLHAGFLLRGARPLRRRIEAARGQTVYIVVSHLRLDRPRLLARMQRSGRVRLVFFVHDIIPSQFPELCPPGDAARDRAVMRGAARLADAILANSAATRRDFLEIYGSDGLAARTYVAPLGCAPLASPAAAAMPAQPYFVVLGRIVPRKNHLLLLAIWRRLGPDAPRLVIVGARGGGIENVIDLLERSTALRGTVEERSRVPDAELGPLLAGARALVFPSLAEGYGMPLAEALAAGVPVLCSDLASFREVGGDVPEYLDPLDGPAWQKAVLAYASDPSPRRAAQLERLKRWRAPTWEAHFAVLETVLGELAP